MLAGALFCCSEPVGVKEAFSDSSFRRQDFDFFWGGAGGNILQTVVRVGHDHDKTTTPFLWFEAGVCSSMFWYLFVFGCTTNLAHEAA